MTTPHLSRLTALLALSAGFAFQSLGWAQTDDKLCQMAMKPQVSKLKLHWDSFNMFGNRKEQYTETGFTQVGEGSSCKITSQRSLPTSPERPCTWTPRLVCDLQMGKDAVTHQFYSGPSLQRGKLQWVGNQALPVSVKRGDATTIENREVAIVKFAGKWNNGPHSGDSHSTVYFDRDWGVLLKAEGAHDANQWGDTVTLVEIAP